MFPSDHPLDVVAARAGTATGRDRVLALCEWAYRLSTREPSRAREIVLNAADQLQEAGGATELAVIVQLTSAICHNRVSEPTTALEWVDRADGTLSDLQLDPAINTEFVSRMLDTRGESLRMLGDPKRAVALHRESVEKLEDREDVTALEIRAHALNNSGIAHNDLSNYPEALAAFEQAKKLYLLLGDEDGELRMHLNTGNIYSCLGQVHDAVECYQECLRFARKIENKRTEAVALANIASAYVRATSADDAIDACLDSLHLWRLIGDRRGESMTLNTLALAHRLAEDTERALDAARESMSILAELDDKSGLAKGYKTLGFIQYNAGNHLEARADFERGVNLSRDIDLRRIEVLCQLGIGRTLVAEERFQDALACLLEVETRATQQQEVDVLHTIHRELSNCYDALEEHERALHHFRRYHDFDRDRYIEQSDGRFKTLQVQLQVEQARRKAAAELEAMSAQLREEIQDRKRAESESSDLQRQLHHSQKMEAVGRLAGGVAHDFNNLLTVILGYCEILNEAPLARDPEEQDAVREITRAADRAAELTQQLLTFSRKRMIVPRPVPLNDLVEEFQRMIGRLLDDTITVRLLLDESVGYVHADPVVLEQALINLALNAQDAMPEGGELTITTGVEPLSKELADALGVGSKDDTDRSNFYSLRVRDTGCGIPADVRSRVFEPFFTTKEHGKGTGLGLSTAYGVIRQSGGSIYVESPTDVGATFVILLPPSEAGPAPVLQERQRSPVAAQRSETILLVEDELELRRLLATTLRAEGYQVIEATDGVEALERARQRPGPIELLITDVLMPRMTGAELAARIVELQPKIRMIFTSGYMDRVAHKIPELPKNSIFLPKPFQLSELRRQLRGLLDARA